MGRITTRTENTLSKSCHLNSIVFFLVCCLCYLTRYFSNCFQCINPERCCTIIVQTKKVLNHFSRAYIYLTLDYNKFAIWYCFLIFKLNQSVFSLQKCEDTKWTATDDPDPKLCSTPICLPSTLPANRYINQP